MGRLEGKMLEPFTWRLKLLLAHPASAKYSLYGRIYNLVIPHLPVRKVKCNVCGWEGYRFRAIAGATYIRYNATCPNCGSAERHRALIKYMNKRGDFSKKRGRCLDIGAVSGFRAYFEAKGSKYISIDIDSSSAMIKMNAIQMGFPDNTFDFIICSHVLEHIKEDLRAIEEMFRVLNSEGVCYIMVPLHKNRTSTIEYEKPNILDPLHVRAYGPDAIDRIKSAGFSVEKIDLVAELNKEKIVRHSLGMEETCFICTKRRLGHEL
jgi:SAM-dependent methyltransferase